MSPCVHNPVEPHYQRTLCTRCAATIENSNYHDSRAEPEWILAVSYEPPMLKVQVHQPRASQRARSRKASPRKKWSETAVAERVAPPPLVGPPVQHYEPPKDPVAAKPTRRRLATPLSEDITRDFRVRPPQPWEERRRQYLKEKGAPPE